MYRHFPGKIQCSLSQRGRMIIKKLFWGITLKYLNSEGWQDVSLMVIKILRNLTGLIIVKLLNQDYP